MALIYLFGKKDRSITPSEGKCLPLQTAMQNESLNILPHDI